MRFLAIDGVLRMIWLMILLVISGAIFKRYFMRTMTLEEQEVEFTKFQTRLREPKLRELEKHFGMLPAEITSFYDKPSGFLTQRDFFLQANEVIAQEHYISSFLPADAKNIKERPIRRPKRCFAFAQGNFQEYYAVQIPESIGQRGGVYFVKQGDTPGEPILICKSLREFVDRPILARAKK